ncbi:unnamed protein product [Ranitomeya imitator]|uniref:Uncharacterized protein n=1 Tax=Ranitomeya imitator TaxID=111125 RepID=A0ABN9KRN9_9NEOB|nr:unnamed protein product [Ranitomeya imitator]
MTEYDDKEHIKVPVSRCSDPCSPGSWKKAKPTIHTCCYDCIPCSEGEISNISVSRCSDPCSPGSWKKAKPTIHTCCYDCIPCSEGEISNISGRLVNKSGPLLGLAERTKRDSTKIRRQGVRHVVVGVEFLQDEDVGILCLLRAPAQSTGEHPSVSSPPAKLPRQSESPGQEPSLLLFSESLGLERRGQPSSIREMKEEAVRSDAELLCLSESKEAVADDICFVKCKLCHQKVKRGKSVRNLNTTNMWKHLTHSWFGFLTGSPCKNLWYCYTETQCNSTRSTTFPVMLTFPAQSTAIGSTGMGEKADISANHPQTQALNAGIAKLLSLEMLSFRLVETDILALQKHVEGNLKHDIVPVYQIKGISKLVKLCLPKVQCFCDSLTSPPSERQFNALLISVASLLANGTLLDEVADEEEEEENDGDENLWEEDAPQGQ